MFHDMFLNYKFQKNNLCLFLYLSPETSLLQPKLFLTMFRSLAIPLPSRRDFDDFDRYLSAPLPEDLDIAEDFVSYEQALAELTYDLRAMDEETKEEEEVCMCGECPGCGKPIADCVLSDVWCTTDHSVMGACMKCSARIDYDSEHIMNDISNTYMPTVLQPPQVISPPVMLPLVPLCIPSAVGGPSTFMSNPQAQPLQYYTPVLPAYEPVIETFNASWCIPIPLPQYMRCQPRVNVKIAPRPAGKALTPCIPLEARTRLYEGCLDTPSTFNSDLLGCIDTLASVLVTKLN